MHPVNRRVTTEYLHTQSVTTRRRSLRNDKHKFIVRCQLTGASAPLPIKRKAKCLARQGGGV